MTGRGPSLRIFSPGRRRAPCCCPPRPRRTASGPSRTRRPAAPPPAPPAPRSCARASCGMRRRPAFSGSSWRCPPRSGRPWECTRISLPSFHRRTAGDELVARGEEGRGEEGRLLAPGPGPVQHFVQGRRSGASGGDPSGTRPILHASSGSAVRVQFGFVSGTCPIRESVWVSYFVARGGGVRGHTDCFRRRSRRRIKAPTMLDGGGR